MLLTIFLRGTALIRDDEAGGGRGSTIQSTWAEIVGQLSSVNKKNFSHILAKLNVRSGQIKFNRVDKNYFTAIHLSIMIHVTYTHRLYLIQNFIDTTNRINLKEIETAEIEKTGIKKDIHCFINHTCKYSVSWLSEILIIWSHHCWFKFLSTVPSQPLVTAC